jgi:DNA-directed RNA polymerase beta' subunit
LKTLPGKSILESFEVEVIGCLNDAINKAGALTKKNLPSWNRLKNMVTSGSKGSDKNIS